MSSSLVSLKTHRVGTPMPFITVEAKASFRLRGVKVRRRVPVQVLSSSFDRGSKLRGLSPISPIALMLPHSATLI
ncbi:hypothetical protein TNCV_1950551 [Trichonephila clavipes]|nr:hypothetical protein TNCV_1950551 [Trichonephila clavipes]